jgi:hypothetical protein
MPRSQAVTLINCSGRKVTDQTLRRGFGDRRVHSFAVLFLKGQPRPNPERIRQKMERLDIQWSGRIAVIPHPDPFITLGVVLWINNKTGKLPAYFNPSPLEVTELAEFEKDS